MWACLVRGQLLQSSDCRRRVDGPCCAARSLGGCARLSEGWPCLDPVSSIASCAAVLFSIVVPSELASQLHLRGLCFGLDHLKVCPRCVRVLERPWSACHRRGSRGSRGQGRACSAQRMSKTGTFTMGSPRRRRRRIGWLRV